MLLSISSSSEKTGFYWGGLFTIIVVQVFFSLLFWEKYWRSAGHIPTMIDTPQLWSIQRMNVYKPDTVVFIGASRSQYGISIAEFKKQLPNTNPVMLAVNGAYPLAVLKHLAEDRKFNGLLVVDIDARGMLRINRDNQQYLTDYYDHHWNVNWYIHRRLLNVWQSLMVSSQPQLAIAAILEKHIIGYTPPFVAYSVIYPKRDGFLDFSRISPADLADNFAIGLKNSLIDNELPEPLQWLDELDDVVGWVEKIEQRGGRVIFFEPPVSGRQAALVEDVFIKANYWDAFFQNTNIASINYRDEKSLQVFELPDESHVAGADRAAYTAAVINIFRREKYLQGM